MEKKKKTSDRHSGLLNGYQSGDSPFFKWACEHLGDLVLTNWSWGEIEMDWSIGDKMVMPDGVMFGGHIASVADHIVGLVSMSVLERDDERFRTSRLETNFFRPLIKPRARVIGRVTNASKNLIHAEADIFNANDKLAVRIYAVQMKRMTAE
ncbi:MAG: PaaI family thioesterase [Pseudomonadota bacterium]